MSISVEKLSVGLLGRAHVLKGISFSVEAGDVLAIVGPNGAGKTTLLKALSGDCCHEGSIKYSDQLLENWALKDRALSMAVLPQLSLLNFPYTAEEVVSLGRIPHGTGKNVDGKIVSEAIDKADLSHLSKRLYPQLSGGEKQRTHIARAIAQISTLSDEGGGKYLLLDEPTSSLDMGHQQQLMGLVRELAATGVTIVMVMHDVNLASRYADSLLALKNGRLLCSGAAEEVVNERIMRDLYGVDVRVSTHPDTGKPVVLGV